MPGPSDRRTVGPATARDSAQRRSDGRQAPDVPIEHRGCTAQDRDTRVRSMVAEGDGGRDQPAAANRERFELERFGWGAPDRLELSGTFVGLRETDPGPPVLVLWG